MKGKSAMTNIEIPYDFRFQTADGTPFGPELECTINAELTGGAFELTQVDCGEDVFLCHNDRKNWSTDMRIIWDRIQDDLWNDEELERRAYRAHEENKSD